MVIASSFIPDQAGINIPENSEVLVSKNPIVLTTQKGVHYPLEKIKITQGYRLYHPALDLDGVKGDAIYPIMAGRVEAVDHSRFAYGKAILIDHGNSFSSLYAHLSKIDVEVDEKVAPSTKIGEVGATGHSSGDHLHLELRDHGKAINPLSILPRLQ